MSRAEKTAKKEKPRKPVVMPRPWKGGYFQKVQGVNEYVASGRGARGVPDDYLFNAQTGDFDPPKVEPEASK